ncbi:probable ATP-dependent helicase PF08_0048 isoform X2 [Scylla paramamosain]|uniref:probable ATP-dependent helicase PF08_0048 isoform X2 n=1 Tax=Scylla paramamosain TaxID=85552 RepID=UPI003082CEE3
MKPPPLLLLLLVAGFVSCIPQGRHEGGGAEDSLVPQSGVGSSGSSKNLSEDADQQSVKPLPREVRSDDDTQARNDLREPNLVQTQSNRTRSSRGHGQRVSSSQEPKSCGADGNNFQQNDKGNSAKKEGMEKNDDEDDDEDDDDDKDDKDDKSNDDEDDKSNDEVDKEETGEESLRKPPKSRKTPKKGWNERRTPRFREGHDDAKRGYGEYNNSDSDDETSPLLEKQTKSREKRQPGRRGGSDSDSSNSDNANEETPLLRSSRNTTEKKRYEDDTGSRRTTDKQILPKTKQKIYPHDRYQKLRQRDSGGSGSDDRGQEINKRIFFFSSKNKPKKRKTAKSGLRKKFSGFKSWVKKKIHNDPPYQRFHDSEGYDDDGYYEDTEGHDIVERGMRSIKNWFKNKTAMLSARRDSNKTDDGGRDNNGYDGRDEMYDNDDDYNDETMLLPAKKWRRLRAFFTRYRNKRGNLDLLERVLRNFALASSRLEEEVTPTTSPPPLLKNKIEKDVNGGNEDEDDKVSKYEEGDSEDEGIGRDYYNDG